MEKTINSDLIELTKDYNRLKEYKTMLSDLSKELNGMMNVIRGGNIKKLKTRKLIKSTKKIRKSKKTKKSGKPNKSRK